MSEIVAEEFEHEGIPIKIIYDQHADNPREMRDSLTSWVWASREWRHLKHDEEINLDRFWTSSENWTPVALAARWLTLFDDCALAIPFKIAEGSQAHAWLSDLDDNSCDGFITVSRKELDENLALSPEWDVMEYIQAEFNEYDAWIRGEVYGWVAADGDDDEESCWGYYGDFDYVREQAKEAAADIARERFLNTDPPDVAEVLR